MLFYDFCDFLFVWGLVFQDFYEDGIAAAIDIGITSPLQQTLIKKTSVEVLAAGLKYYNMKMDKYEGKYDESQVKYLPFKSLHWQY